MSETNRQVLVNGVTVEFHDDTQPAATRPMRATLHFLRDSPYVDTPTEALDRLIEAGVLHLPLYRSEAEANGVQFEEV